MTALPEPKVSVTPSVADGKSKVTISQDNPGGHARERSFEISSGASSADQVREAVEKTLADPVNAEFMPATKK